MDLDFFSYLFGGSRLTSQCKHALSQEKLTYSKLITPYHDFCFRNIPFHSGIRSIDTQHVPPSPKHLTPHWCWKCRAQSPTDASVPPRNAPNAYSTPYGIFWEVQLTESQEKTTNNQKKLNVILWGVAFFGCQPTNFPTTKIATCFSVPSLVECKVARRKAERQHLAFSQALVWRVPGLCDGKNGLPGETNATNIHERTEVFALIADISREGFRCKLSQNVT